MTILSNTYFQNFLKLIIVGGAFYYILNRIDETELVAIDFTIVEIILLLIFSFFSWSVEIIKWKNLADYLQNTTLSQAAFQSLSSHTVAIITPNRIGEYGAKAIFFNNKKKILVLNFIGNLYQMIITILFGFIGFTVLAWNYKTDIFSNKNILITVFIFVLSCFILFKSKKRLKKSFTFIKEIPKQLHFKVALLSLLKYVIFSHQFYYILTLFNVELSYFTIMPLLFSMYLLASILPTFSFFDFVIKGSAAIYLFELESISPAIIATVAFVSWVLNFAIPALIGSALVLNYKQNMTYDSN
jgi:hypothetical protein